MLTVGEHFLYLPSAGYCLLVGSQLPEDPRQVDLKQRRALAVVAALVMIVCVVRTTMFTNLARESSRTIAAAAATLEAAPDARLLLVEDLPAAAALAFPHAVRLALPGRDVEIEILSLLSYVMPGPGDYSEVQFPDPAHLTLHRAEGFLGSYLERALAGPRPAFQAGERIPRDGYEVRVTDASDGRARTLAVTIFDPAHAVLLGGTEQGLQVLTPRAGEPGGSTFPRGPER
jgi:hypothetical protein